MKGIKFLINKYQDMHPGLVLRINSHPSSAKLKETKLNSNICSFYLSQGMHTNEKTLTKSVDTLINVQNHLLNCKDHLLNCYFINLKN